MQNLNTSSNALAIYTSGNTNISGALVDNNNYYTPNGNLGYYNSAVQTNINNWKTATGKDTRSYNINPNFISTTDLHLNGTVSSLLESGGTTISGISIDIDGQTRPGPTAVNGGGTAPDIEIGRASCRERV